MAALQEELTRIKAASVITPARHMEVPTPSSGPVAAPTFVEPAAPPELFASAEPNAPSASAAPPVEPVDLPPPEPELPPATAESPAFAAPVFATAGERRYFGQNIRSALDLEEMLGTKWLNKLGVAILVLGVAFFLAYELQTMRPAGKDAVGFLVGAGLLVSGVVLERREVYRILARAAVGGGWALLFFTTYAP